MALPDHLQLHRRLPARHQDHAGHPGGLRRDRGAPDLTPASGPPPVSGPTLRLLIRADGAARGNPGPASAGAVLIDATRPDAASPTAPPLALIARPLGIQTNNYAEYTAVILALERALALGAREVELVLDSKLVVEQLTGRWKVRHAAIRPLVDRAQALLSRFARWTIRHEPRAANFAADALANLALDDPAAAQLAEAEGRQPDETPARSEPVGRVAVGAAAVLIDWSGRALLVRHGYGRHNWELPGGAALPGEPPDAAARRELREETGLSLEPGRLAGVYFEPDEESLGPLIHFVFRFTWTADLQPAAQPPEIDDVGFWPPDRLPRPISDFTERRIVDALSDEVAVRTITSRVWRDEDDARRSG